MPTYTTEYVKNISTGEPFTFEVTEEKLKRLETQKRMVQAGSAPLLGSSVVELVENFEFSQFPAYEDLLKIFVANGFSTDLITKILQGFGANESFIRELLRNKEFISRVMPWFEGIACDGGRVIGTLRIVYMNVLAHWKSGAVDASCQERKVVTGLIE